MRWHKLFFIFGPVVFTGLVVWMSFSTQPAQAQQMPPTPTGDRLAPWPTVYPPTQADLGAQDYWAHCMMCHGDRGQGDTADWLSVMNPQDRNCWQSGCHNPRHPPDGFVFPKVVPSVIGPGALESFSTGLDVYHFIKRYMPYQSAGHLSDPVYWELTAYLLRANGLYSGNEPLDVKTAAAIQISPKTVIPDQQVQFSWQDWAFFFVMIGSLAVFGIFLWRYWQNKGES
jgi:cytochrome c